MITFEQIIGVGIIVTAAVLMFILSLPQAKRPRPVLRPMSAFTRLRKAIGLAVENGTRLHITLGKSGMVQPTSAAALAGLATLERVAQISIISDRPPVATSGDGGLAILSQDTLRAVYRMGNVMEMHDPDRGRLAGATPFSYIAGTLPIAASENVSTHILVGNFGPEAALLVEAAEAESAFSLAATDSLPAQAALFASAQEPLIGEEIFAIPAYLETGKVYTASLQTQDILRWIVIAGLVGGSILKVLGVI